MATKGKGVAIIVNCLQGHDFYAAVRSIANHGSFFQLAKTAMKNKEKLGNIIANHLMVHVLIYLNIISHFRTACFFEMYYVLWC